MEMLAAKTMGAMLTVVLVPSLPTVSSVRSTLETHMDQKDLPCLLELGSLSDEITLAQAADVWRAAVEFKRR